MITKEAIEALRKSLNGVAYISVAEATDALTAAFAAMPGPAVKVEPLENDAIWARFYRDGKTIGEICHEFNCGVYDLSPWLTAPLAHALTPAPDLASENERLRDELMPMLHLISVFSDGINERNWADKATYIKQQVNRIRAALERT